MQFTHLHVHSHYSILDGMSKVPDLIAKCQRTGMNAMALTDHGNMYGIKEFLDTAKKVNGKAKGKVKDCEEAITKAKAKIADLPKWEKILQEGHMLLTIMVDGQPVEQDTPLTAHDRKDIQEKIADAKAAQKELPILEEDLPKLKQKAADYVPFKPIVGVEAYCARRSRLKRDKDYKEVNGEGKTFIVDSSGWHLILLAKNKTGYFNLCRMVSLSFIDGYYNRPRIDKDLLKECHEGIICSSACLGGELPQLIMAGKIDKAEESVEWFKSVFGDDYYIEIQRHYTDKPNADHQVYIRQQQVNPILVDIARRHGVKVICTNDAHFVEEEHAEAHDRLICLSTGKFFDEQDRLHYTKQEWLKSPDEMAAIFADIPEALANTQEIVDKIEVYDIDSDPIMPKFPIPKEFGTEEEYRLKFTDEMLFEEFTRNEKGEVVLSRDAAEKKIKKLGGCDRLYRIKLEADYLAKLAWEGAHYRYGEELTPEQIERITFELHIMKTMGFPGYFLIVHDYIRAAREELGVSVGPGRGSAAGSVVAYCLRITDVDPLPYDLLFERFLNPDRISLPDIDVDFDDAGRGRVLQWVSEKYGHTHVAHIITYGAMASKSAIADVGRVQRIPLPEVNRLKEYIPERSFPDNIKDEKGKSPKVNLPNCYKYVPELKEILQGNDDDGLKTLLTYAGELENTVRQVGVHACGVIIGADDLTKFAPLATVKDRETGQDIMVTEYDGHVVESVGLIKMDFLGLITLTIIKETLANIRKTHDGLEVDIDHIPIDDELTFKLFAEGKTIATFQFESPGMQKYLRELKPTVLPDLIAMNALYRPGPMDYIPSFIKRKNGQEAITYDLPVMETYLKDTYGVTVYQEQVMLLSRLLADFTRGESDKLRKAMGKKQMAILQELKGKFMEGGRKNGHDPEILEKIWRDWEKFASYAFNKSHATCYAWVAYQTGYLKAHYPSEYMAANLTIAKDDIAKVTKLMEECKAMGLRVLEPSVNDSELNFTVDKEGAIRFGLGGIKGVGEGAVEAIISERTRNGKFRDIFDFVERISLSSCNRKAVECMAYAGAFDCFPDFYREQLFTYNSQGLVVLDTVMRYGNTYQADQANQQNSLFGDLGMTVEIQHPELPKCPRWNTIDRLNKEKEMIGIYLSSHPLDEYEFEIRELCNITSSEMRYFDKWKQNYENKQDPTKSKLRNFTPAEDEPDPVAWLETHENAAFRIGGLVTKAEIATSFKGSPYGRYTLEDYEGPFEFALFDDDYSRFGALLQPNAYVMISGTFQQRGADRPYFKHQPFEKASYVFRLTDVEPLSGAQERHVSALTIRMPADNVNPAFNGMLQQLLIDQQAEFEHLQQLYKQGDRHGRMIWPQAKLRFVLFDSMGKNVVHFTSQQFRVNINATLYAWLKEMRQRRVLTFTVE